MWRTERKGLAVGTEREKSWGSEMPEAAATDKCSSVHLQTDFWLPAGKFSLSASSPPLQVNCENDPVCFDGRFGRFTRVQILGPYPYTIGPIALSQARLSNPRFPIFRLFRFSASPNIRPPPSTTSSPPFGLAWFGPQS